MKRNRGGAIGGAEQSAGDCGDGIGVAAAALLALIESEAAERFVGFPERLAVRLNGVLGAREPMAAQAGHEIGLVMVTLAPTQEMAYAIAGQAAHMVLHHAVPQWQGLLSNLAFPVAPHFWPLGEAWRFVLHHVVEVDDPLELHTLRYEEI